MTVHRDVYLPPRCPSACCGEEIHERLTNLDDWWGKFILITMNLRRDDPPLVFLLFAGIALMVNSERDLPAGSFENCTRCGAGTEGCECEPNLLAILAREEGGSEWQ